MDGIRKRASLSVLPPEVPISFLAPLFSFQFLVSSTIHASTTIAANAMKMLFMASILIGCQRQQIAVYATATSEMQCGEEEGTVICLPANEWPEKQLLRCDSF